ncbi:MAG TPA: hypothetical protein VJS69_12050 [Candidatus Krumholzibacteria bacterium]|nr:hypothetical protein [Candidatus Krumholzibacteria bacterium]
MRRSTNQAWSDLARVALACAVFVALNAAPAARAAEATATNLDLMQKLTAQVVQELHSKFAPSLGARAVQLKPAATSEDYYFVTNVLREELTKLGIKVIEPAIQLSAPMTPSPAMAPVTPGTGAAGTQGASSSTAWTGTYTQASAPPDTSHAAQGSGAAGTGTPGPAGAGTAGTGTYVLTYQNVVFAVKYVDSHRSFVVGGKRVARHAAVRMMTTLTDPADGRVVWVGEAVRESDDEIDYGKAMQIEQGSYAFNKPIVPSAGWGKYVEPVFVTGIIVGLIYLFFSNQSNN